MVALGLWALGIINAALIASFVMKHISKGDEQVISVVQPVPSKPQEKVLQLEILNGCGARGIAQKFSEYLEGAGYNPVKVDNFENFDMPNTLILDRKSRDRSVGLRVAKLLGVAESSVLYQASEERRVDVSVIIGKDYPKLDFLRSKQ